MTDRRSTRLRWFGLALASCVVLCSAAAPASIDMTTGIRYVVPNGSLADCSAKAKMALESYLQNATESSAGSGEWTATGPLGVTSAPTAAAAVHCSAVDKGYVVNFTCVVESGNPYNAGALCLNVAHKFSGKTVTALATAPPPTPVPTGCTTVSLVGVWQSGDSSGPTLTMDASGGLTDNQGVSGNWALNGTSVALTYYGNHTLQLSSDGKHLRGAGYYFTRKC